MRHGPSAGPERYVLALALLVPLAFMLWLVAQMPAISLAAPTNLMRGPDNGEATSLSKRPQASRDAPPPTLAPPTATPRPSPMPAPTAVPTATPERGRTYVVKPGDELKHIAADYGVSIWKIIQTNDIPNPDSLRVGQVLRIPDE
jgi:nucleoid-associated protein YgaU